MVVVLGQRDDVTLGGDLQAAASGNLKNSHVKIKQWTLFLWSALKEAAFSYFKNLSQEFVVYNYQKIYKCFESTQYTICLFHFSIWKFIVKVQFIISYFLNINSNSYNSEALKDLNLPTPLNFKI